MQGKYATGGARMNMQTQSKTITLRQLAVLAFIVSIGAKCFTLPLMLQQTGGRSAWIVLSLLVLLDVIILIFLAVICRVRPNRTVFAMVESTVGKVASKAIFAVMAMVLGLRALILLHQIMGFFSVDLLQGVPRWVLLLPMMFLLVAFGMRSLRTLGRTAEILIFVVIPSMIILAVLVTKTADFTRVLPLTGSGEGNIGQMFMHFVFFAGDCIALFVGLGKIKHKEEGVAQANSSVKIDASKKQYGVGEQAQNSKDKEKTGAYMGTSDVVQTQEKSTTLSTSGVGKREGFAAAVIVPGVIAGIAVCAYALLVFSTYMDVRMLINPTSSAFVTHTAITRFAFGRFDKVLLVLLSTGVLLTLGVVFYAAVQCAQHVVGKRRIGWISHTLAIILYFCAVFINTHALADFIKQFGVYIASIFMLGFLLFVLVCAYIKRTERGSVCHAKTE